VNCTDVELLATEKMPLLRDGLTGAETGEGWSGVELSATERISL